MEKFDPSPSIHFLDSFSKNDKMECPLSRVFLKNETRHHTLFPVYKAAANVFSLLFLFFSTQVETQNDRFRKNEPPLKISSLPCLRHHRRISPQFFFRNDTAEPIFFFFLPSYFQFPVGGKKPSKLRNFFSRTRGSIRRIFSLSYAPNDLSKEVPLLLSPYTYCTVLYCRIFFLADEGKKKPS